MGLFDKILINSSIKNLSTIDFFDSRRKENVQEQRIIKKLVRIGKSAVEPLIDALTTDDVNVSGPATIALGLIGDLRAVEPLIKALESNRDRVLEVTAKALG